ncbi:fatty-acid amide hydrolase [Fusarium albosuccineum]|uniref:Fatty-acid amide hydrolase n=1 Tax=Fusarium albosuccineum TaxID=1237068 RepID=A0A8H4P0X3_9HYPO|nr:fatty-acid amide hydrolase [Fusarium albosuccineum]
MSTLQECIQPALAARNSSLEPSALLKPEDLASLPLNVLSIPRECKLLTQSELNWTENYDATDLLQMLAKGEVSAQALLMAFRKRATIAQQCTNCLTELIPQALAEAKARDEHLARTGQIVGHLHGLPVSVKEQISVSGLCTNAGFVAWVNNLSTQDANIVTSLKKLGAVVFARTNQPQSLMHVETSNNIYGATVHPMNRKLTAGGSTGGEAALMAMKGSPLGIGGDIGGSIRVPASLNGIYGFLPSPGRISGEGAVIPTPGCDSIVGTLGPFARSLRDVELFCHAYSSAQPWVEDISLVPSEILSPSIGRQLDPKVSLRVGILLDDGVVSPLPPVRRVMEKVRSRLKDSSNIELKAFTPWDHAKAWRIIASNYFEDAGADIRKICHEGGEPLEPLTEWILHECEISSSLVGATMQARKATRDAFRQTYAAHWRKAGVDVVVSPVNPSTALPLGTSKYWGYSSIWNLLSYPAIALPAASLVGEKNPAQELAADTYEPKNETEAHIYSHYSAATSEGMPVGIQVVAPRLHETLLMEASKTIEEALKV